MVKGTHGCWVAAHPTKLQNDTYPLFHPWLNTLSCKLKPTAANSCRAWTKAYFWLEEHVVFSCLIGRIHCHMCWGCVGCNLPVCYHIRSSMMPPRVPTSALPLGSTSRLYLLALPLGSTSWLYLSALPQELAHLLYLLSRGEDGRATIHTCIFWSWLNHTWCVVVYKP
jgi:hypothetical protein